MKPEFAVEGEDEQGAGNLPHKAMTLEDFCASSFSIK